MKRINFPFLLISFVLMKTASGAASDRILEKLEGTWLANFQPTSIAPGTTASFPKYFLTGNVGGAWEFKHDGTLVLHLPCDVNEQFKKGEIAIGSWKLDTENNLHVRARMLDESKGALEIDGQIEFDSYPSKKSGAGTMTISSQHRTYSFGRYEENAWSCATTGN